jgi:transposase
MSGGASRARQKSREERLLRPVQERLDKNPDAMRKRRETVEHSFCTTRMRMGATNFLTKTLPKVATEVVLHMLAYNLTREMNIVGVKPIMGAVRT